MLARFAGNHAIRAALISVGVFFFLLYVVIPNVEAIGVFFLKIAILEWHSTELEIDEPEAIGRAISTSLSSALSTVGALLATYALFPHANRKAVSFLFGLMVAIWAAFFFAAERASDSPLLSLNALCTAVPPLFLAYLTCKTKN